MAMRERNFTNANWFYFLGSQALKTKYNIICEAVENEQIISLGFCYKIRVLSHRFLSSIYLLYLSAGMKNKLQCSNFW